MSTIVRIYYELFIKSINATQADLFLKKVTIYTIVRFHYGLVINMTYYKTKMFKYNTFKHLIIIIKTFEQ